MINETHIRQFQERGYFILENAFGEEELRAVEQELDRHVNEANERLRQSGAGGISRADEIVFTAFLAEKSDLLREFVSSPAFVNLTSQLIGPNVRLYWNQAVYKYPETEKEFPWHQDNGYTPLDPEQYYTCWISLNGASVENGCVWVLPGSHKGGTRPHENSPIGRVGYKGEEKGVPVQLPRGGMGVFSSLTLHRSGPNLTDGVRKGYIVQYIPAHARSATSGADFSDRIWIVQDGSRPDA